MVAPRMALDSFMLNRLDEIRGTFEELTERLADPDVLSDSAMMMRISKQRSSAEATVTTYEEYEALREEQGRKRALHCPFSLNLGVG